MPQYIKSNGTPIDTGSMADKYLAQALAKARREGNEENIKALEEELVIRQGESQ